MRKPIQGFLILVAGCGLGWYAYHDWQTDPSPSVHPGLAPLSSVSPNEPAIVSPTPPGHADTLADRLARNEFAAVLQRFSSLQDQAGDIEVADARTRILAHASQLIDDRRFSLAEQLLDQFLVAAFRDVEARTLLAAAVHGQQDFSAAIDQLYEARGHAFRPDMRARIAARIRAVVAEFSGLLERNDDQYALLALYQHLIALEPEHAPWYMGLAAAQLALNDRPAARRTLELVARDPAAGEQAQSMLAQLDLALAGTQEPVTRDSVTGALGIPLQRRGNHFLVEARAGRGPGVQLLIDTGASLTIFTPVALAQRGIRYRDTGRTAVFTTANGTVRAPVYELDALAVGDWQVDQLNIGVLDLEGNPDVDGLLGMNFLQHFEFFIDQDKALLRLTGN